MRLRAHFATRLLAHDLQDLPMRDRRSAGDVVEALAAAQGDFGQRRDDIVDEHVILGCLRMAAQHDPARGHCIANDGVEKIWSIKVSSKDIGQPRHPHVFAAAIERERFAH